MADVAVKALEYWYKINPENWNWWWNDIGKKRLLSPIALLLLPKLPVSLIQKLIDDLLTSISITGANKADLAHGIALSALLNFDDYLFKLSIQAILDMILISSSEGIQSDYSY